MTSDKLITDFCALWADADVAKIVDYFTDDVVYHNIPMEPVVGREPQSSDFGFKILD